MGKVSKQIFLQGSYVYVSNKHMKRCLTSCYQGSVIRATMTRLHTHQDSQNQSDNKVLAMMWRNQNPHTLLVGMQKGTFTLEIIWQFLTWLNGQDDPAISLLGTYLREMKIYVHTELQWPIITYGSRWTALGFIQNRHSLWV